MTDYASLIGLGKALVYQVASKHPKPAALGKKALQKLVYIAQEAAGVPAGYNFVFYTYGPYSKEVSMDLDILESQMAVEIDYDPHANAYKIRAREEKKALYDCVISEGTTWSNKINHVVDKFGNENGFTLELFSTILYVTKTEGVRSDPEVIDRVSKLKPKYDRAEILARLLEWRQKEIDLSSVA